MHSVSESAANISVWPTLGGAVFSTITCVPAALILKHAYLVYVCSRATEREREKEEEDLLKTTQGEGHRST